MQEEEAKLIIKQKGLEGRVITRPENDVSICGNIAESWRGF